MFRGVSYFNICCCRISRLVISLRASLILIAQRLQSNVSVSLSKIFYIINLNLLIGFEPLETSFSFKTVINFFHRNVNQLLLLIRTLYDCASDDVIIVPANQSKLRKTACCAIQSLCSEVSTSSRRTPVSYMEKIEQSIQTDKDVLRMLEQLH